jgi:hypothetical protein
MRTIKMTCSLGFFVTLLFAGCDEGTFPGGDGGNGGVYYDGWGPTEGGGGFNRPQCPGEETTILGKVLAPNGQDPVPGATVFIPASEPEMFPPAVQCEVCGHLGGESNLWFDTSKFDGSFTLTAVCPGTWPLVFQNGRFRRLVRITVPAKSTLQVPPDQSRLPRRDKEFEQADAIPKIAVATGDYDKMECALKKLGLQDGQFDLYEGAFLRKAPKALPAFSTLVKDLNKMKTYNVIFINCTNNTFENLLQDAQVRKNLGDYVTAGGRLYVTDWSYDWIERIESFSGFIDFEPGASDNKPEPLNAAALGANGLKIQARIMDSQMAQWLGLFPGAISNGLTPIEHFLVDWVVMLKLGQETKEWVQGQVKSSDGTISGVRPLTVTFNFQNCGKILFTSYHTEGRENELLPGNFPSYCGANFSPQDRILEYLIFDIASCIKPIE